MSWKSRDFWYFLPKKPGPLNIKDRDFPEAFPSYYDDYDESQKAKLHCLAQWTCLCLPWLYSQRRRNWCGSSRWCSRNKGGHCARSSRLLAPRPSTSEVQATVIQQVIENRSSNLFIVHESLMYVRARRKKDSLLQITLLYHKHVGVLEYLQHCWLTTDILVSNAKT